VLFFPFDLEKQKAKSHKGVWPIFKTVYYELKKESLFDKVFCR